MNSIFRTKHGIDFDLLRPTPDMIDIRDIAYHLAGLNRFTGATRYTVAEHSVVVSHMVSPSAALAGLLHDAAEAYLGDMARTLKRMVWLHPSDWHPASIEYFEQAILQAVHKRFGIVLTDAIIREVKTADISLGDWEHETRIGKPIDWVKTQQARSFLQWPLCPNVAELRFLDRFKQLTTEG